MKSRHLRLYGLHAVKAALANPARRKHRLSCTRNAASQLDVPSSLTAEIVDAKALSRLAGADAVHQGAVLEAEALPERRLDDITTCNQPLFMLDQVTDPHNIGAILRSAQAFGFGAVILPKDNAPMENAVMAKAACGALEQVPLIHVTNLAQAMQQLKDAGYWMIGLDNHSDQSTSDISLDATSCIILGAEGKGMRRLTREHCDHLLRLDMDPSMESLNVSNAAAIVGFLCYQSLT